MIFKTLIEYDTDISNIADILRLFFDISTHLYCKLITNTVGLTGWHSTSHYSMLLSVGSHRYQQQQHHSHYFMSLITEEQQTASFSLLHVTDHRGTKIYPENEVNY